MSSASRWLLAALLVGAGGCGSGNSPTSVTSPSAAPRGVVAGSIATMVRGDTGAPVAGAALTVAGRTYLANAEGNVRIEDAAPPGALVDVTAPTILDRQTTVGTGPLGTVVLWPRTSPGGIDEAFTTAIVYTASTREGGPAGAEPLRRLASDTATVVVMPSAEILDDPAAHAAHATAVARLTAAARGAVLYALARERPAAGIVFDARMGPDEGCADRVRAFARLSLRGGAVVGGELVYCSWEAARAAVTVVHEMGHTFGLRHSNDSRDVMFGTFVRGRGDDFNPREVEVMSLLMQRRAGNRFPDSDRGLPTAAVREDIIVCR